MLSLLAWIYGKVTNVRNRLYERGVFETFDLRARTVSIGNITTGGTGKTPLVAYIATLLVGRGEKVCILTRGYGRESPGQRVLVSDGKEILANIRESGDEPFELAQKLIGKAIVIADADRVSAAEWAKRKFGVTAFVLDDGFQHRRAKRDLDIVCIDATNPFGGRKILPAGRLREPLHNLKRADVVVITRSNLVERVDNLKSEISKLNPVAAVFEATNKISQIIELVRFNANSQAGGNGNVSADLSKFGGITVQNPAYAFCGIGNPANFYAQLRQENFVLVATLDFPDHQVYTRQHITFIEKHAARRGCKILLTTAKDAVKLRDLKFEIPCFVVEIEMEFDDANGFTSLL